MKNKIIAGLLAATMILSTTACGSTESLDSTGTSATEAVGIPDSDGGESSYQTMVSMNDMEENVIDDNYRNYLLERYEDTYYPEKIIGAGKAVYVERNYEMINKSHFCIVYYDEQNAPTTRKNGTKIALDYAVRQGKRIINIA